MTLLVNSLLNLKSLIENILRCRGQQPLATTWCQSSSHFEVHICSFFNYIPILTENNIRIEAMELKRRLYFDALN